MINIRAMVDIVLPIKKTIPYKDMPLNLGSLEIFSEDKQRKFIVDLNYSESNSDWAAGEKLILHICKKLANEQKKPNPSDGKQA